MAVIVTVPHPILRQIAKPVTVVDKRVLNILQDMELALKSAIDPQGVGLAAPQIGVSLRIFMIRPDPRGSITTFINPEILKFSQRTQSPNQKGLPAGRQGAYEGCLSLPRHYAPVTRSMSVTIKYLATIPNHQIPRNKQIPITNNQKLEFGKLDVVWSNLDLGHWSLREITESYSGFPAHIIQHELDHLNGILFIDHVLSQNAKLYKVEDDTWQEINF